MTPIRRSIPQPDGTVTVKSRRGPYRTDTLSAGGRAIVVELHPTHLVLRELGCRRRGTVSYARIELLIAQYEADQQRREKQEQRRLRRKNAPPVPTTPPRRTVRRGVLI